MSYYQDIYLNNNYLRSFVLSSIKKLKCMINKGSAIYSSISNIFLIIKSVLKLHIIVMTIAYSFIKIKIEMLVLRNRIYIIIIYLFYNTIAVFNYNILLFLLCIIIFLISNTVRKCESILCVKVETSSCTNLFWDIYVFFQITYNFFR